MSQRLTKKKKHYDSTDIDEEYKLEEDVSVGEVVDKLGQLEDIEEELGIDLITLIKALKNGIWLKDKKDQFLPYRCLLRDDFILVLYEDIYKKEYLLKDYGKTWALTREELKND